MNHKLALDLVATHLLFDQTKQNYSDRDMFNITLIFNTALMDKMYELQDEYGMSIEERLEMTEQCGKELKKLIHTYTGIDTIELAKNCNQ